jgi:hypothetical protein
MRSRASTVIISVMAVSIAVLLWAVVYFARDEWHLKAQTRDDDLPVKSQVGNEDGFATVHVSEQGQRASGIVVQELEASTARASTEVYGTVVNIQPLLDLRARYVSAVSEARALRAAAANSEAEYHRVKKLFDQDRNVSERSVQAAQAQWSADQAHVAGADQAISAAYANLRAGWGDALAKWASDPESEAFEALTQQRQALVQLVFPFDMQAQAAKSALTIAPASIDAPGRPARYVSSAPQGDSTLPGATYFYVANGEGLRAGMRIAARLHLSSRAQDGVIVPAAAVVWHGGKAWAYVREDDDPDTFVRKEVATGNEVPGGWFNAANFEPGDEVVVSGAQLLLSEEQKFQIRNENED